MTPKALFICLGISFTLWLAARVHETGGGAFRDLIRRFLAQSCVDRAVILIAVAGFCHWGGSLNKSAGTPAESGSPWVSAPDPAATNNESL